MNIMISISCGDKVRRGPRVWRLGFRVWRLGFIRLCRVGHGFIGHASFLGLYYQFMVKPDHSQAPAFISTSPKKMQKDSIEPLVARRTTTVADTLHRPPWAEKMQHRAPGIGGHHAPASVEEYVAGDEEVN